jgi:hypothetical protein
MEATMWGGAITRLQLQQTISRLRKIETAASAQASISHISYPKKTVKR